MYLCYCYGYYYYYYYDYDYYYYDYDYSHYHYRYRYHYHYHYHGRDRHRDNYRYRNYYYCYCYCYCYCRGCVRALIEPTHRQGRCWGGRPDAGRCGKGARTAPPPLTRARPHTRRISQKNKRILHSFVLFEGADQKRLKGGGPL